MPTKAIALINAEFFVARCEAVSKAINEPILCPVKTACCTCAASNNASNHVDIASTVFSGSPLLRPWPGRSTAKTENPWYAK